MKDWGLNLSSVMDMVNSNWPLGASLLLIWDFTLHIIIWRLQPTQHTIWGIKRLSGLIFRIFRAVTREHVIKKSFAPAFFLPAINLMPTFKQSNLIFLSTYMENRHLAVCFLYSVLSAQRWRRFPYRVLWSRLAALV